MKENQQMKNVKKKHKTQNFTLLYFTVTHK